MKFKLGVRMPKDLDPRMFIAFEAIEWGWSEVTRTWMAQNQDHSIPGEPTITSWDDGVHGANSWHRRRGRGVDVRTKTLPRELVFTFREAVVRRIGALGFDVIIEDFNGDNEHMHVELDGRADQ